ncbi:MULTISPECIES: branched-chain amino acid ABC transporter permease [unclassified Paenibacillus]|uniref:branched-chain amino acid ABC transporter permease n=1 Tax=unclassified Paenibacillus TaxID=185978 RepID=UPI001AE83B1A|nr:neutral amino acid transport system permease protein [Paenibacillus sp. PvP091]MBP1170153.1 neutral amino acid transport system permease protein [Paenibacillus sp. PvR098]MBP2441181.1 neutral amino acid transport system permease protein [Paenibacillus sp. PvP052]
MDIIKFGIVTGCILLLSTVGFSMIWKSEKFLNIAHGQLILVGAYIAYLFNVTLGLPFAVSAIGSVVVTAFIGLLIAKVFYYPVRHQGQLVLLFTSIGLAYVIYGTVQALAGTKVKAYNLAPTQALTIGGKSFFTPHEIAIIFIAITCALSLHIFLAKSKSGRGIRAMAENIRLAQIRGIHFSRLYTFIWLIASGLAGLAGVLLAMNGSLHTDIGWIEILVVLSAAVLGGSGAIYGAMLAALIIGLSMDFSTLIIPASYRPTVAFLIIILVLFIRPQGLSKGGST